MQMRRRRLTQSLRAKLSRQKWGRSSLAHSNKAHEHFSPPTPTETKRPPD
jgi:hypothetical protein